MSKVRPSPFNSFHPIKLVAISMLGAVLWISVFPLLVGLCRLAIGFQEGFAR